MEETSAGGIFLGCVAHPLVKKIATAINDVVRNFTLYWYLEILFLDRENTKRFRGLGLWRESMKFRRECKEFDII